MFKLAVPTTRVRFRSRDCNQRTVTMLFVAISGLLVGCPVMSTAELAVVQTASPSDTDEVPVLLKRINTVLTDNLKQRRLSTDVHGAWQILHGVLAYGREFNIRTSAGDVGALDYILRGGAVQGFELRSGDRFEIAGQPAPTSDDPLLTRGIRTDLDPGSKLGQGHRDQWLAYLAACQLPLDQPFQTLDGPRRLDLWLRQIEWNIPLNFEREYSWTLMSLVPYRDTTHRWAARDGQDYSIESLLRSEIDQLSPDSACGGSHRLVAIAVTLNKRKTEGQAITGVWADAQSLVDSAILQAIEFQNDDGTFSSNYFERNGWSLDLATAIGTTGHTLEFIAVAGNDEVLTDLAVMKAAASLCRLLEQTQSLDLECGALYHALSGLQIYRRRLRTTET